MAVLNDAPMPAGDALVYPEKHAQANMVTRPWQDWFNNVSQNQGKSAVQIAKVELRDQSTSILAATDLVPLPLTAGLYRFNYYLLTVTTSSVGPTTLDLTLSWRYRSTARSETASIDPSVANSSAKDVFMVPMDNASTPTYTTTNNGDGTYDVYIVLEEVAA